MNESEGPYGRWPDPAETTMQSAEHPQAVKAPRPLRATRDGLTQLENDPTLPDAQVQNAALASAVPETAVAFPQTLVIPTPDTQAKDGKKSKAKDPKPAKAGKPPRGRRSKHVTERYGVLRRIRSGLALLFLTAFAGASLAGVVLAIAVVIVVALRRAAG